RRRREMQTEPGHDGGQEQRAPERLGGQAQLDVVGLVPDARATDVGADPRAAADERTDRNVLTRERAHQRRRKVNVGQRSPISYSGTRNATSSKTPATVSRNWSRHGNQ